MVPRRGGRVVARAIMLVAIAAAAVAVFENLALRPEPCEFCGAEMRPFRPGDAEWIGSGIYECTRCRRMIDTHALNYERRQ